MSFFSYPHYDSISYSYHQPMILLAKVSQVNQKGSHHSKATKIIISGLPMRLWQALWQFLVKKSQGSVFYRRISKSSITGRPEIQGVKGRLDLKSFEALMI
jgi:hypothetical protein